MTLLPAGRELDALVAEKVMGKRVVPDSMNGGALLEFFGDYPFGAYATPWTYSTDIAKAWKVLDALATGTPQCLACITSKFDDRRGLYYDVELRDCDSPRNTIWPTATCEGPSLPEAICLAALDIVEARRRSAGDPERESFRSVPTLSVRHNASGDNDA